jgi:hypothetical protein
MSRGSDLDYYLKLSGGIVVVAGLLAFVLPNIIDLSVYLSQRTDAGAREGVELIGDLAVNWWVPLALSAPFLFVGLAMLLHLIGAEDVLEM